MDDKLMIKKQIGSVVSDRGINFCVFSTGNSKYLLFTQQLGNSVLSDVHIPIKITDLKNDIRKRIGV